MGSTAFGTIVRASGAEKEMYRAIISYLHNLDSRITCANDPDDEFDVDTYGSSKIPVFNFSINGTHIFKLVRPTKLKDLGSTTGVHEINCSMDAVSGIPTNSVGILFRPDGSSSNVKWDTSYDRGIIISHLINENIIFLSFSTINSDQTLRNNNNFNVLYNVSDGTVYLSSSKQLSTYDKTRFYNLSDYTLYNSSNLLSGSFLSRFSYGCPPGKIDYIKSSIYQNNNEKAFENRAIYDSTAVTIGSTISLKDGSYVAVGTHQLVKVS